MMAIMVLGGLAMLNSKQYNDPKIDDRSATPKMKGGGKTACLEPMERKHPKTMRGWRVFWPHKKPKLLKIPVVVQGSVGIHPKPVREQVSTIEPVLQSGQLQYSMMRILVYEMQWNNGQTASIVFKETLELRVVHLQHSINLLHK